MFKFNVNVNGTPRTQYASSIRVAINDAVRQALAHTSYHESVSIVAERADNLKYGRYTFQCFRPATDDDIASARPYMLKDFDGATWVFVGDFATRLCVDSTSARSDCARSVLDLNPDATTCRVTNASSQRGMGRFIRQVVAS